MVKNFPQYAINCIENLENHGFEAWFVGGCVRDLLSDRPFYDIDIATNALPDDVIEIFEKTIPTGITHGTVTVILENNPIEVTTYRSDGMYIDNRHPETVAFERDIKADLSRRDFTINAFALNKKGNLIDLFGGEKDLKNKLIRCVGNPEKRFCEDALRILRAYRFSSTLNFSIESETLKAIKKCGNLVEKISGERVLSELKKLVTGENVSCFIPFINENFLSFCGIGPLREDIELLTLIEKNWKTRLPIFIMKTHYNKEQIKAILKPDNTILEAISFLEETLSLEIPKTTVDIKKLLFKYGKEKTELYFDFLKVSGIDADRLYSLLSKILINKEPYLLSHLSITGEDLLALGIEGKAIGDTLNRLCLYVIENPLCNNKDDLLKFNH